MGRDAHFINTASYIRAPRRILLDDDMKEISFMLHCGNLQRITNRITRARLLMGQPWLVVSCRLFEACCRSHLKRSSSARRILEGWDETSVAKYQSTMRNIPEEIKPHLHRGRSLKSTQSCPCPRLESYRRCRDVAPLILNFGTTQRVMVRIRHRSL